MTCDLCNNPATVHLTQIVESKMVKVNLCKSCAAEKGVEDPTGFELTEMLEGMGEETTTSSKPGELRCESCGFTQSDFKKSGRFGCASCYQVFSGGLESLLEAMHRHTEHKGKVPQHFEELRKETEAAAGISAAGFPSEEESPSDPTPSAPVAEDDDDESFLDDDTLAALAELSFDDADEEEEAAASAFEEPSDISAKSSHPFGDIFPEEAPLTGEALVAKLQQDLEEAIKVEDYEKAAEIRDRINELEKSD